MSDFIVKKPFSSIRWGNKNAGDPVDGIDKSIVRKMVEAGLVEMTPEYATRLRMEEAAKAQKKARLEAEEAAKKTKARR